MAIENLMLYSHMTAPTESYQIFWFIISTLQPWNNMMNNETMARTATSTLVAVSFYNGFSNFLPRFLIQPIVIGLFPCRTSIAAAGFLVSPKIGTIGILAFLGTAFGFIRLAWDNVIFSATNDTDASYSLFLRNACAFLATIFSIRFALRNGKLLTALFTGENNSFACPMTFLRAKITETTKNIFAGRKILERFTTLLTNSVFPMLRLSPFIKTKTGTKLGCRSICFERFFAMFTNFLHSNLYSYNHYTMSRLLCQKG